MTDPYREPGDDRSPLVVAFGARVFGVAPHDGSILWEHAMGTGLTIEILFHRGRVYATSGWQLHCLDHVSGALIGKVAIPNKYKGRPTMVIEGDRLYVGTSGEVCCFALDGTPLWVQGFQGRGLGHVALGFPGNVRQADDRGS